LRNRVCREAFQTVPLQYLRRRFEHVCNHLL
jgi:hypothetical protein